MPFSRPTLTDLRQRVAASIAGSIAGATSLLRYANLRIIGTALAGLANGLYGYLDWIAKQAVPFTATGEYLVGWASLKGVNQKQATAAAGMITFSGANSSVVLAGMAVIRADGATFITSADATIVGGAANAPAVAATPGAAGNTPAGTQFTLSSGAAGVSSTAVTLTGMAGGADVEDMDDLRGRMLDAFAQPPQGGAERDYVSWALAVAGVTRAWVRRNGMGPGTVVVYFMMDDAEAGAGGFPQGANGVAALEPRDTAASGDQLVVANALFTVETVTALVYACAPGQNAIGFAIAGLSGASTATKAAVTAAIKTALLTAGSPGGVNLADGSPGGVVEMSAVDAAILTVPGVGGFVVTAVTATNGTVSPGVAGNITSNTGFLPVLGAVTFP